MSEPKLLTTFRMNSIATKEGAEYAIPEGQVANSALAVPAFYSGTRAISETLACLPKGIFKKDSEGREKSEHYANRLLTQIPNDLVNAIYLWETAFTHAVMYGNGYIWIQRKGNRIVGLHTLHACLVRPKRVNGTQVYEVRYRDKDGKTRVDSLAYGDVIHIRNFSEDGEVGLSVIDQLAASIQLPMKVDKFVDSYFENGAAVNLAIEGEKGLSKEDVDTLRYGIERQHKGIENAHNVMVLAGATAKNLTSPLKDFALDVLKQSSIDDIARVLRLPPHVLYSLNKSNYNSLEWLGTELVKYSFTPWVAKTELEIFRKVLTTSEQDQGYYFRFNLEGLQRGDFRTRAEVGVMLYTNNLITKNEFRAKEELPADPIDGDKYFRMLNMAMSGEPTPAEQPTETPAETVDEKPADETQPEEKKDIQETYGKFIADAVERVRTKQLKAFGNAKQKGDEEYGEWLLKFADHQSLFLADAMNPLLETVIEDAGLLAVTLQSLVEKYAKQLKDDGEKAEPSLIVNAIIERIENGKN